MRMLRRPRACRRGSDEGFTLIEMTTALFIVMVVLVALVGVYLSAARTIGLAKQRQGATALANQTMEELRALPYDTVAAGLNSGDLSGDANISGGNFKPTWDSSINEPLQTNSLTNQAPLYPHVQTGLSYDGTSYTVSTYVTQASTSPMQYWLTVVATWNSAASSHSPKRVVVRDRMFNPAGCLSSATHPFSGVCQAFQYGEASSSSGTITFTGASGADPVSALDLTSAQLSLAQVLSGIQVEQTVSASGGVTTSGATVTTSTGTQAVGSSGEQTGVDNDPSTTGSGITSATTPSQSSGPLTVSGSGGAYFSVSPTTGDSGSGASTLTSSSSTGCTDTAGGMVTAGWACTSGTVTPSGSAATMAVDVGSIGPRDLGAMTLASVGPAPSASSTFSARYTTSGGSYCPSATTDACVAAAVSRALGNVALGGLPTPVSGDTLYGQGFQGMVLLTGYSDYVSAQSGYGAGSASPTVAGSLSYWNGSGYTTDTVANLAGQTLPVPDFAATYALNDGTTATITISTSLVVGTLQSSGSVVTPCQPTACVVTQARTSPVIAAFTYTITHGGTTVATFQVGANLGTVTAKATYKGAPSA